MPPRPPRRRSAHNRAERLFVAVCASCWPFTHREVPRDGPAATVTGSQQSCDEKAALKRKKKRKSDPASRPVTSDPRRSGRLPTDGVGQRTATAGQEWTRLDTAPRWPSGHDRCRYRSRVWPRRDGYQPGVAAPSSLGPAGYRGIQVGPAGYGGIPLGIAGYGRISLGPVGYGGSPRFSRIRTTENPTWSGLKRGRDRVTGRGRGSADRQLCPGVRSARAPGCEANWSSSALAEQQGWNVLYRRRQSTGPQRREFRKDALLYA